MNRIYNNNNNNINKNDTDSRKLQKHIRKTDDSAKRMHGMTTVIHCNL